MSDEGTGTKFRRVLLWFVTIAFGLAMLLAGANKFVQPTDWIERFQAWGYPAALSYVIGGLEVVGAVLIIVPRFATYAGAMIAVIMCGAAFTLVMNPGTLGPPTIPLVNVIAFAGIAYARRGVRWTP
jgi:uncharacterized membrane protein YphA (DoxX/SURF4 family)